MSIACDVLRLPYGEILIETLGNVGFCKPLLCTADYHNFIVEWLQVCWFGTTAARFEEPLMPFHCLLVSMQQVQN